MEKKEAQYAEIIKLFAFVLHRVRLYSEKHPAAQLVVRTLYTKLEEVLGSESRLTFGLIEDRLLVNDHPLDHKKSGVDLLLREYRRLGVETLIFEPGLSQEEIRCFLSLMAAPPKALEERGGFKKVFEEANFQHVGLGTSRYRVVGEEEEVVGKSEMRDEGHVQKIERMEELIEHCLEGTESGVDFEMERLSYEVEKKPQDVVKQMVRRPDNVEGLRRIVEGVGRFLEEQLAQPMVQEGRDFSLPISGLARKLRKAIEASEDFKGLGKELGGVLERRADGVKVKFLTRTFVESGGDVRSLSRFLGGKHVRDRLKGPLRESLSALGAKEKDFEHLFAVKEEGRTPKRLTQGDLTPKELEELLLLRSRFQAELARRLNQEMGQVREKTRELEVLIKVNKNIASLLDREILFPRIPEEARNVLKVDSSNFRLIEGEDLVLKGVSNPEDLSLNPRLPLGENVYGRIIREDRVLSIKDVLKDPTMIKEYGEILDQSGYRSFLGVPVRREGRVIGTMDFWSKLEREFGPEEVNLISSFADHAAISVENANLFAELQDKNARVEKTNRQLEEANRAKSEFLAAMSHELRTPLNVIMGNLSLFMEGLFGEVTAKQKTALDKTMHYSRVLLRLVNSVLTLVQVGANKDALDVSTVKLEEVVAHTRAYVEELNRSKGLEVLWGVEPGLPPITTDALKLKEVLQNLIGNAFQFTHQGTIEVRVRDLKEEQRVEFVIADTGIGIEKEDFKQIFGQFFQHKEAHTGKYSGVGLGLTIVKNYLDLMKGQIQVESQPGKGSVFNFTLPYSV